MANSKVLINQISNQLRNNIKQKYVSQVKEEVQDQIKSNFETEIEFGGDLRLTHRKNKTTVSGSKRDTVDLGELRDSLEVTVNNKSDAEFEINATLEADYAEFVMYGFVNQYGRIIPPRLSILDINISRLLKS
jgi:hypothetical protein